LVQIAEQKLHYLLLVARSVQRVVLPHSVPHTLTRQAHYYVSVRDLALVGRHHAWKNGSGARRLSLVVPPM
jgi:hypothetical protein